jgi:hypothetical protein
MEALDFEKENMKPTHPSVLLLLLIREKGEMDREAESG